MFLINLQPNLQGSLTTNTSSENFPAIPRIAPGFSMVIPKSEKKIQGADLAKKPAYVSVSVPKNDAKAVQHLPDAVNFSSPFYLSLLAHDICLGICFQSQG
jgi:hypothetical protein